MNIYTKLIQARLDLQNLKLKKTGKNDYSNFTYYELGDFLPAVNELASKHGLFTRFNIISDKGIEKAILTIINAENPEEKVDFISPTAEAFIGSKMKDGVRTGGADPIQNLGGKTTYMRRYLLMTAFEMVESDQVDSIKRELLNEMEEKDIKAITKSKTLKELTETCSKLKLKYKTSLITPLYDEVKAKLEQDRSKA